MTDRNQLDNWFDMAKAVGILIDRDSSAQIRQCNLAMGDLFKNPDYLKIRKSTSQGIVVADESVRDVQGQIGFRLFTVYVLYLNNDHLRLLLAESETGLVAIYENKNDHTGAVQSFAGLNIKKWQEFTVEKTLKKSSIARRRLAKINPLFATMPLSSQRKEMTEHVAEQVL